MKYRNAVGGVDVETEVTPKEVVGAHEVARALVDDAFVRGLEFREDNFQARRASQSGAGVAYDPESLLTGKEIAQGLDYDCPRDWTGIAPQVKEWAHAGNIAPYRVAQLAPRVARVKKEEIHG